MLMRDILSQFKNEDAKNLITTDRISLFECAALSLDVYGEPSALPPGWVKFMDSGQPVHGYYGAYYIRNPENPTCIAFAHRGTVLDLKKDADTTVSDLISALQIARESPPHQYKRAANFALHATEELFKRYTGDQLKNAFFVNTGHSLGGVLADMCSGGGTPSITFENPGSKNIIIEFLRKSLKEAGFPPDQIEKGISSTLLQMSQKCMSFQADMNIVNMCNEQVGKSFVVLPRAYDYFYNEDKPPALQEIKSSVLSNLYYAFTYSLGDQHRIVGLYNKLKNGAKVEPVLYPIGFQNGYRAYLDYSYRKEYWDEYIKSYWNENIDSVQTDYEGNFDEFNTDFIEKLNDAHHNALTNKLLINDINKELTPLKTGQLGLFSKNHNKLKLREDDFIMIEDGQKNSQDTAKKKRCVII